MEIPTIDQAREIYVGMQESRGKSTQTMSLKRFCVTSGPFEHFEVGMTGMGWVDSIHFQAI